MFLFGFIFGSLLRDVVVVVVVVDVLPSLSSSSSLLSLTSSSPLSSLTSSTSCRRRTFESDDNCVATIRKKLIFFRFGASSEDKISELCLI